MQKKYRQLDYLHLPRIDEEVSSYWAEHNIFDQSMKLREQAEPFVFYEGPPSANARPGIHHVMARAIKDIFCRYKTQKGYYVQRKGGWDTHGLPIELEVEKELGITKEDIGKKISIEEYNQKCKERVMRFTDEWNDLTRKMGYWVDLENPYITYTSEYMESLWWCIKQLYEKGYLYKGFTIQPYSPAAGTGLSSHELNQPGTYKDVTDTTVVAQFKVKKESNTLFKNIDGDVFILAWTTTPWTLPSNTALTIGKNIEYVLVDTFNQYTHLPIKVILAKPLLHKVFGAKYVQSNDDDVFVNYNEKDKNIPFQIVAEYNGKDLVGLRYEQLLPWATPCENAENAFQVIDGDFVTTEDGTGVVHTAPTFGADDFKVAQAHDVPPMLVLDENGNKVPLVNLQGKFINQLQNDGKRFENKYVKNEYYKDIEKPEKSVDVDIAILLKEQNRAFKVEKYVHPYPHCWRTDKPVLYYPLDSWFIKVTAVKERLIELNNTINWKPESTGTGRFGKWLENVNDWNLSRSRFWGTPLPIWRTEDGKEEKCIGSIEELKNEIEQAKKAGIATTELPKDVDLHKNVVDKIVLVSKSGKPMYRESDLIDVWFDSGAMPYAQWAYPNGNGNFNAESEVPQFPADFIAEGVDQTRGWFYTLHVLAVMLFDSVAYKNVVSNGLVLDKNGEKMSKRKGNAVDPFETLKNYGADATRWYMITNAQPWDNLKFDLEGITETRNKFFGTLFNTYQFFALYANVDGYIFDNKKISNEKSELDLWIISKLHSLIKQTDFYYAQYEPTQAGRLIQDFVENDLSNWFVRLSRRRFWKGEMNADKQSAYDTLYQCLIIVSKLSAPIAPFFSDFLYQSLNNITHAEDSISVHLTDFPTANEIYINKELEQKMNYAQRISSMILSLRKKSKIRVRQPLQKIIIPSIGNEFNNQIHSVKELILSEVNVKELELVSDSANIFTKKAKPNFKLLGKKLGSKIKSINEAINQLTQQEIKEYEQKGSIQIELEGEKVELIKDELEIITEDIEGLLVNNDNEITVALDSKLTDELLNEGNAREIINRIQKLRKDLYLELTDRIKIYVEKNDILNDTFIQHKDYICTEVLANGLFVENQLAKAEEIEIFDDLKIKIHVEKD